jgi:hypothetical protein
MPTVYRIEWVRGNAVGGPPKAVEAEQVGWPHVDADGQRQTENTHFATELAAWLDLLKNTQSSQQLSERELTCRQEQLAAAAQRLADDAAHHARMERAFEEWQRKQKETLSV